ncbi:MAG: apolipoprotein N-acyltransferase [Geminicoccaceae bacterium]|nr:apolipoprotein N-acyltransferase [Geminicoccaceae bacterium]
MTARAFALPGLLARQGFLSCFLLGAGATLALPPFHVLPALLAFSVWLALLHAAPDLRAAALRGFAFGLGWHLSGLWWIGIAFFTDAERFGALAVPAVLGLAALNALFPAAAALLARIRPFRSPLAAALALALSWSVTDGLREKILLGFTWNPLAVVWTPFPAFLQPAAWIGAEGLSLLTAAIAILPGAALLERGAAPRPGPLLAALLLACSGLFGLLRLAFLEVAPSPGTHVRIVQGNIAQHHKWDPQLRARWLERHLELSALPAHAPLDLVVWPESAVPYLLEREPRVRELLGRVAPEDGYLITGGDRIELSAEPPIASNSVFVLDATGTIRARYDKVDLVPFGEYLPWRAVLERLGLEKLTQGSFDFVPGPGRRTLRLPGAPSFGPLVCYEAIFPGRAIDPADRPAWLLNVTNDAWFGTSPGPFQHAAMARLRAVEEGLPLVRAANTGISYVVDAAGRLVAELPLNATGVLDAALPGPTPEPPLFRKSAGRTPIILFLVVLGALAWQETLGWRRAREWAIGTRRPVPRTTGRSHSGSVVVSRSDAPSPARPASSSPDSSG